MLSTTTILLACTSIVSSSSSAITERIKSNNLIPNDKSHYHKNHLPQHRIRRPERQVPYPKYHPFRRHLERANDDADSYIDHDEKIEEGQRQQRRRRRRRQNNSKEIIDKLFNNNHDDESPETIIVDKVLLDNSGEFLHYWTVTGRNLILNSSPTTITEGSSTLFTEGGSSIGGGGTTMTTTNVDEISDESAKLLMDVDQLTSSSNNDGSSGSSSGGGEGGNDASIIPENTLSYNDPTTTLDDENLDFTPSSTSETITSETTTTTTTTTTEQNSIYQPIRLRAIFTDDNTSGFQYLTDTQRTILMEQIVNPALFAWSKALRVVPVGGRDDDDEYDNGDSGGNVDGDSLVLDQTQLYDNESCGPGLDSGYPSVRVPLEHMTDGIPETDTVIYISVSFSGGGGSETDSSFTDSTLPSLNHLHRSSSSLGTATMMIRRGDKNETEKELMINGEGSSTDTPSESPSTSPSFPPSETEPNVDTRPICPGTYVASATHCNTDQYDRPVAGILSLCIDDVHNFFYNDEEIQRNSMAAMHEIGHILGFNAESLAYFRDPDTGEPLTPRDENGDVPYVEVECTGIAPTTTSMIPLPSEDIVQFQTVRGGVRVATVVTPTVRRVARNMFGCQSLLGAELQSGEGQDTFIERGGAANNEFQLSPGECIGNHWQRILFRKDLLNPVIEDVPRSLYISPLTLAYFKDCGWYDINYDRIAPVSMWGRNAGCNFAQKTCITSSGLVQASNIPFFCSNLVEEVDEEEEEGEDVREPIIHGCDVESSRKAFCSLVEYDEDIPPEFNYFGKAKSFPEGIYGGKDPTLDYCPVFVGYDNGRCDDKDAEEYAGVKSFEVFGEDNSRCVMGHVDRRRTSLCLPIACVVQDHSLRMKVDGYWKLCDYSGQVISMWWNPNDYVVCPDPARMCPSFYCPHDCLKEEGGVCDYELGQCMCEEVDSLHSSSANTTNWLSRGYKKPVMVPCSGSPKPSEVNETFAISPEVERIDLELLPEYYVDNATILLDEPKVFEDKVSRMFSQLSSGEVMGLVASFVVFVLLSMYVSTQAVKCYKQRLLRSSIKRARSRMMSSLPDVMRSASRPPNESDSFDDSDSQSSSYDRRPPVNNPQKDKMVANLLLQNRLELGNITTTETTEDGNNDKKQFSPTIANLSSTSLDRIIVNRSELPPLEEGRVLAVVENDRVLAVVDDENQNENRYARSSATSATREHSGISEFTSPLYQDDEERGGPRTMLRHLRLRRNII